MKKILWLLLVVFLLTGCIGFKGNYKLGLKEVERPEKAEERYGDSKIINFEEEGKTKYSEALLGKLLMMGGRNESESPADFRRNWWPTSIGITGRNHPESVAEMNRNRWPKSSGICR